MGGRYERPPENEPTVLTPQQRAVLHLLSVEGMSAQKAAKALGMNRSALYVELSRIKERIGIWGPMHRLVSWYLQVYLSPAAIDITDIIPKSRKEYDDDDAVDPTKWEGRIPGNNHSPRGDDLPWYLRRNRLDWLRLRKIEEIAKEAGIVPPELASIEVVDPYIPPGKYNVDP